ncbi:hypothetical protein GCM10007894_06650 [Paraferrimonas haliotis]|uniref:DUF2919 family protein n=2 Tax=Paraferrimonas haliotis TaxID=2013866 RepID=A0AA37TMX9_9GAMM|nr:hypothetical protein GCM10007894_06650 [Paraferrimonas haliotis]
MLLWWSKAWLVWILSLTYRRDTSLFISIVYPSQEQWQQALFVGIGAMLMLLLITFERRRSPAVLIPFVHKGVVLLWLVLAINAVFWLISVVKTHGEFHLGVGVDGLALLWSTLYVYRSRHLPWYFKDWKADSSTTKETTHDR